MLGPQNRIGVNIGESDRALHVPVAVRMQW